MMEPVRGLGLSRRVLLGAGLFLFATPDLGARLSLAAEISDDDLPDLIQPPTNRTDWPKWRESLKDWRMKKRAGFTDSIYKDPISAWSHTCYCCHKIMVWDEAFLDHKEGKYKVEEYLDAGEKNFGGFDAVVLWQAYPRIGFDERNQFDYYRGLPGGLAGLADAIRRFHRRGVKVFIDYNPWDTGTRREPTSDEDAIAELVNNIGADGVFLDTMTKANSSMRVALDRKKPGVVFETELPLPLEGVEFNQLSWAQWLEKADVPGVLRDHWLETRHMMHAIRRWDTDHTNEIHLAWMNGAGVLVWENVFGSWNPWSQSNCRLLRTILPIQRYFAHHFLDGEWDPLIETDSEGVCVSSWKLGHSILYTAVNPAGQSSQKGWTGAPSLGYTLFDLISGSEVKEAPELGAGGIGAILSISTALIDDSLHQLLDSQRFEHRNPPSIDRKRTIMPIVMRGSAHVSTAPADMRSFPGGTFTVKSRFRARECGEREYAHFENQVYPELHKSVDDSHRVTFAPFAISDREVSNREFGEFLSSSGYKPRVKDSFLQHWSQSEVHNDDDPVVYVSLEDAEAFCEWKKARLPTDFEWQLIMETLRLERGPKAVWNWTSSAYSDGQTRFVLIKGGADYEAKSSIWYADGGRREPNFVAKFIQIWPGLDRCSTVGFRYVFDLH